jgi:threonine aldolase
MNSPIVDARFASDNTAAMCPEAWEALARANSGFAVGYGEDDWTRRARELIRDLFETDCETHFVFNGTAANSLAMASLCDSHHAVIGHRLAHIDSDECGAPGFFRQGMRILSVAGENGKLSAEAVESASRRRTDVHYHRSRALSLTQSTELGTVYRREELGALGETARRCGLRMHMDGARLANACASTNASPAELTWKAGVEVLCLGGVKNGLMAGEAVVFFDRELALDFGRRCKQAGQLSSKMRFLTAPWVGLLESGAWLRHAGHANRCAARLAEGIRAIEGMRMLAPVEANAVFVDMPRERAERLHALGRHFYEFGSVGGYRLMCSWQTTEADVDALLRDMASGA